MAISASEIVQVVPRVLSGTGKDLTFNGLFFTQNKDLLTDKANAFSSASAVGEFFGFNSQEYVAASVYFGGYSNSLSKPGNLYFYKFAKEALAGFCRGAVLAKDSAEALAEIKKLSAGTLTITIDGTEGSLSDLDFAAGSVNSLSDVASTLETKLHAQSGSGFKSCKVAYSSQLNAFTITSGTTGASSSVTVATGTAADALSLTSKAGAVVSAGCVAVTYAEALNNLTQDLQNFVTFSTIEKPTLAEVLELAKWSNTQATAGNQFLYVYHDDDVKLTQDGSTGTIADELLTLNLDGVCGIYGDAKYAAFIMGIAASIAWSQANSTITFKFKSLSGLEANVVNTKIAKALEAKRMNFVGKYSTRNDSFIFLSSGEMFGQWSWIDAYLNATWLNNALQVQIMAGFELSPRVAYTSAGYAQIRSWCMDVIKRAKNNGVLEAGVSLSETQKTELQRESGLDISSDLYNNGYYLQILDASVADRQQRLSPPCNFWYTYGGAVHKLSLPSTAIV